MSRSRNVGQTHHDRKNAGELTMSTISRRHVLRGAGVALALPWLEALSTSPARAADAAPVKRFVTVYMPNGASTLWWKTTGSGVGSAWQLSPLLEPFTSVKNKMLLLR